MTGSSSQIRLLSNAIEFTNQNHRVISQNLANVNTPDYHARQLSFEQLLAQGENNATADGKLPEFKPTDREGLPARSDGNNVDMDAEVGNLRKNTLIHQTLIQLIGAKFDTMKAAIRS